MTSSGTVIATVLVNAASDAAGNPSFASTSTDNSVAYTSDLTPPTVTINQAVGQADPTNTGPINFSVVFSEPVLGFTSSDINFVGSSVGGALAAAISGSGPTYTVAITGMTGTGTVVASIPASAVTDAASNPSFASTSTDNSVTFDNVRPTVTINQAVGQADPTNTSPINFTVVFSEPVLGFTSSDLTLAGTSGGTKTGVVTGSGTTYNVAVSGMTSSAPSSPPSWSMRPVMRPATRASPRPRPTTR